MGYLSHSINIADLANDFNSDGAAIADLLNEIGYSEPSDRVIKDTIEALDDDGRIFLKKLNKAIAEDAGES